MRRILTLLVVATAMIASGGVAALEGQKQEGQKQEAPKPATQKPASQKQAAPPEEKVAGKIKSVDAKALVLQLETADKRLVKFSVNGNTKIAHSDTAVALAELKAGSQVVVTMDPGKTPKVAVAIELADLPSYNP